MNFKKGDKIKFLGVPGIDADAMLMVAGKEGEIIDTNPELPFGHVNDQNYVKVKLDNGHEVCAPAVFFELVKQTTGLDAKCELQDLCNSLRSDIDLKNIDFQVKAETKSDSRMVNDNGVDVLYSDGFRMFETGSIRSDNTGRPRFDYISPLAERWLAEYLGANAGIYGGGNYLKGQPEKACIESLKRHLNDVQIGLDTKDESKIDDAVGVLFNAMSLCHTILLKRRGEYKIDPGFNLCRDLNEIING